MGAQRDCARTWAAVLGSAAASAAQALPPQLPRLGCSGNSWRLSWSRRSLLGLAGCCASCGWRPCLVRVQALAWAGASVPVGGLGVEGDRAEPACSAADLALS